MIEVFKLNPYYKCVTNKNIDLSKCTILCHMEDLNIYHVNPNVVDNIICILKKNVERRHHSLLPEAK